MNGDGTRQAGVVNDREESGDDVEQTPMCSSPHHGNSTDVDGSCRRSASDQPTDADDRDDEADGNANWKTFGDILENFAEDTSLLGVPRAILASTRLARLFWVVVCVTCMIMFIEGSTSQLMRYFSYPKQVTVEMKSEAVSFPAVTLCNYRNLDFDVINSINEHFSMKPSGSQPQDYHTVDDAVDYADTKQDYDYPDYAGFQCGSFNAFMCQYIKFVSNLTSIILSERYGTGDLQVRLAVQEASARFVLFANMANITNFDVLSEVGIKRDQYVASCSLGGLPCNMTRDFSESFHPYYFNCFKYYKQADHQHEARNGDDGNSEDDLPWLMPGLDNGLSVVVLTGSGMLDTNKGKMEFTLPGLYDAAGVTAGSDGVHVMIHPPDVVPFPLAEGFDVPPGFTASLGVRPRRNKRIGPPHGDCIDQDPFSTYSGVYRQMACQQRCLQQHVLRKCNCYDESLPVEYPDPNIPLCRKIDLPAQCSQSPEDVGPCIEALLTWHKRLKCTKQVRKHVHADRAVMTSCQCRAACDELFYDVTYSMARWPAPGFEGDAVFHDIFNVNHFLEHFGDSETIRRHFNETGDRTKALQDFARINVYVADPEVLVTTESPEYDETALVSDIGGQLGLWIGASLITAAEVLEFIWHVVNKFFDLRSCRRRRRPRRTEHSAADV